MESPPLAPVYLDNQRVTLQGDPRPRVAKVVAASGRDPERFDVVLIETEDEEGGIVVSPEDVLDRTQEPTRPIYLTCVERDLDLEVEEGLGSPYSRTGTDTAEPGMARQEAERAGFGSGTGKGTSSGARESGKPTAARSRMAAGLEDPFGREGLHGKADPPEGEAEEESGTGQSGTGSESR